MYTAHYDHLGINPALPGDKIYNGAVDNGTGCGILLELAHAFSRSAARPPHPVLFASVTAEEKGLLGSNYLGKHLPIPASQVALDLNFDAVPPIGMPEGVNVTGAERTTFYPVVEKTAEAFGFEIQPDAEPGAGHYYRSDHFSLARVGVPSFSINTGPSSPAIRPSGARHSTRSTRPSATISRAMNTRRTWISRRTPRSASSASRSDGRRSRPTGS